MKSPFFPQVGSAKKLLNPELRVSEKVATLNDAAPTAPETDPELVEIRLTDDHLVYEGDLPPA